MSSANNRVALLCWGAPSASERNAGRIAAFMGAEVTVVSVASATAANSFREIDAPHAALIVAAETLARVAETFGAGSGGLGSFLENGAHVFVYGFDATGRHASMLRLLSSESLRGVESLPDSGSSFQVANDCRQWCGPFSGLTIRTADPARDDCFLEGEASEQKPVLIRVAGRPFFVRVERGASRIFLAACKELADLDEPTAREGSLLPWFSRLAPLMMFLKNELGDGAWHAERPQACFIVDDPLLTDTYGFLDYSKLLQATRGQKFCMSIAFIPWNYRRSQRQIAGLFAAAPSSLSLCIHGCDHTGNEFGTAASDVLRDKARLALERMRAHSEISGVPFDDVMVFPQGLFSPEAVAALDACGYLAAVNTGLSPSNTPAALRLEDALDVAVTQFGEFPLFGRRYPKDAADFAFDLFLGKPALVVEHHGYFRKGYDELRSFVTQLNALDEELEWNALAAICSQACLRRVAPDGAVLVRFYANRFQLANRGAQPEQYVLSRQWSPQRPLPETKVNGQPWTVGREEPETLTLRLSLDPGKTADIKMLPLETAASPSPAPRKPNPAYEAKVLARRMLSEIRDNFVDTNPLLGRILNAARSAKNSLKNKKKRPAESESSVAVKRSSAHSAKAPCP